MLKYFSSFVEKPFNTGGQKLISDMQETIKTFLLDKKVEYKEYSFTKLRNSLHFILPKPEAIYLFFGYLGNPFFRGPSVILYSFFFCLVYFKKKIAREKFYIIVVDLIEWQSSIWINNKNKLSKIYRIFQCFLERLMISHLADEVISNVDIEFMKKTYRIKKIHDLEFLEYHNYLDRTSKPKTDKLVILYAGDLGSRRTLSLKFFESIIENLNESCELWLVARGLDNHFVSQLSRFRNFRFLGEMSNDELNEVAKSCQFGLVLHSPEYIYYNITVPIKLSFYIANGLTVISTNVQKIKELNSKYAFGHVLNIDSLLEFINKLSVCQKRENTLLGTKISSGQILYNTLAHLEL